MLQIRTFRPTPTAAGKAALARARDGTGASRVHAEEQERMPVPKTGM